MDLDVDTETKIAMAGVKDRSKSAHALPLLHSIDYDNLTGGFDLFNSSYTYRRFRDYGQSLLS